MFSQESPRSCPWGGGRRTPSRVFAPSSSARALGPSRAGAAALGGGARSLDPRGAVSHAARRSRSPGRVGPPRRCFCASPIVGSPQMYLEHEPVAALHGGLRALGKSNSLGIGPQRVGARGVLGCPCMGALGARASRATGPPCVLPCWPLQQPFWPADLASTVPHGGALWPRRAACRVLGPLAGRALHARGVAAPGLAD
jgi:hypothetical protein